MPSIRTVDLSLHRKFRGSYPITTYSLSPIGDLALALPRPLEPRTFDLSLITASGKTSPICTFTSERLQKLEATPHGDSFFAITTDDLYLFRDGFKDRLLGDRRLSYLDIAISSDAGKFVAGYTDLAGTSFAAVYGDRRGRLVWLREVPAPISCVAISRDGSAAIVGSESGGIWMVDANRRDVWDFEQREPVRAIACTLDGKWTFYGTSSGTVGKIDIDGKRHWDLQLNRPVFAMSVSGSGGLCAVLCRGDADGEESEIICLSGTGQVSWESGGGAPHTGLSLCETGEFLATSARDGTICIYHLVEGHPINGAPEAQGTSQDVLESVANMAKAGDYAGGCRLLWDVIRENPAMPELCEQLVKLRAEWEQRLTEDITASIAAGEFGAAVDKCATLCSVEPANAVAASLTAHAEESWSESLLSSAKKILAENDRDTAERILLEALKHNPLNVNVRRELTTLRADRASTHDAEANLRFEAQDFSAAISEWEKAQTLIPSTQRAASLARAQTKLDMQEGMAAYGEKRYAEAVFQFQKVLGRDPDNSDATRYLGYAQNFLQQSDDGVLTSRFSHLE